MARKFVCQWCKKKDYDEEMQIILVGSVNKRYHLDDCYQAYQEDKKFKEKERQELDELVEVIKEVHDIPDIPQPFYGQLQKLRNGNVMYGKQTKKKYKNGFPYPVIAETYKEVENVIRWKKNQPDYNFKSVAYFMDYALYWYVSKSILDVNQRVERKKLQEQHKKEQSLNQDYNYNLDRTNNAKERETKKDELDISDFL